MKKIISTLLASCCLTSLIAQEVVVKGPDEKLQLVVSASPAEKPSYSITYNGKTMLEKSPLGMNTNIGEFAKIAQDCGADAISLVNTFNAMAVDIKRKKFVFNNKTAGLSGPAIKPIALRMTYEVAQAVDIPIIAMGGIMDVEDCLEFMMVGASAIQVGTANFSKLDTMIEIIDNLEKYCADNNISDINDIVGIL